MSGSQTRTDQFNTRTARIPSRAQDVVNAVYSILCNDSRVGPVVREQLEGFVIEGSPVITDDDIECCRIEFGLIPNSMYGVRVRLDVPVVEFRFHSKRWTYDEFLAPGNKFVETLHSYLDLIPESRFSVEVEAARKNPEIVKCERVWRAFLARAQSRAARSILATALKKICEDSPHEGERRPFHHDILASLQF